MSDELKSEFELKYPLYLKRFRDSERIAIVDSAGTPVAQAVNYDHAYEIVRLANCSYKLLSDLSQPRPYANPAKSTDDIGRTETEPRISDPTKTHGARMRD